MLYNFQTEDEYFKFEECVETRNEVINGYLYRQGDVSKYHQDISSNLFKILFNHLDELQFDILTLGFKIKTPDANFLYPDIIVCSTNTHRYYTDQPILLVEILSETTRKFDLTDKFIQYQKIPTLQYYMCVEPEQQVILFYFKNENGEWLAETFTKDEAVIDLPALNISFSVKDVYQK